jgi:hypothetical protein
MKSSVKKRNEGHNPLFPKIQSHGLNVTDLVQPVDNNLRVTDHLKIINMKSNIQGKQ